MAGYSFNRESMLEVYLFEATQLMEQLEDISIKCEKDKKIGTEAINEIFRIMHTIKSSSAMMMFDNISVLAHSLEDLFYFIRENKDVTIDFENLFDLVLAGIDFIKGEVFKIQNGEEADGFSEALVLRSSKHFEDMKAANKANTEEVSNKSKENFTEIQGDFSEDKQNIQNDVKSYESKDEELEIKYLARIFYENGCEMENIRAYTVVYNFEDVVSEIYYIPEDIIESNDSAEFIRKNGFLLGFSTSMKKEEIEEKLNGVVFLRKLEFLQIEDYPPEIKALNTFKSACPISPIESGDSLNNLTSIEEESTHQVINTPHSDSDLVNKKQIVLEDVEKETKIEPEEHLAKNSKQQSIISVNISKLDMLLDLVGEIVISEAMVTKNPDLEGLQLDNFYKAARQLRKLTNELQDVVMSIRMVPVSLTFHKMNRIVRDMSKKLNKEAELEIIGEETEVDKNIIDHISDPLMHLVRNALDHGLENKEERLAFGKREIGKITLEAKNAGGDVFIIVKDDGRGLDRKKIYEKAKKQGLVPNQGLGYKSENELTDKEIFSYIILPGFSTNENVTEYSGRGVGMDVVKKNMDSIGGTIGIESVYGKGTTISIKIPLTLAIIDGLEIAVGKSKYTIPITSIRESFKANEKEVIADSEGNEIIMIRGQAYPIYRIHRLFNINTNITSVNEGIMVMVEGESTAACLFADYLIGEQQVVVKALPSYIKKVKGIAGCTILGDGNISLILDVSELLEREN